MNKGLIERCIRHTPLILYDFNKTIQKSVNSLLPVDTGIEFESRPKASSAETAIKEFDALKTSKYLVDFDVSNLETSVRIPSGIIGMIGLYKASIILKTYYDLNTQSGIHYHIDFSDNFEVSKTLGEEGKEEILKLFDSWEYQGSYNSRRILFDSKSSWISFRTYFKSMEIRIGEMTFDYTTLIERILHAHEIAKMIKGNVFAESKLNLYKKQLQELENEEKKPDIDYEAVIKNRVIKL